VFEVGAGRLQIRPDADAYVIVLREVTHERRIEQQMQRQERLAAVGQLAAGIAHDFNNVLQGIVMAGDILTMTEDVPPIMRKMAEDISSEAHRGAKLIRQILDFSRSSVTTRSNIDLLQLIRETADLLRRTIPEDIAIELDLPPDELYVFADTTQLQQIITNLAVNARDAMPDGGELRIEARPFSSSGFETVPTPELAHGDWIVLHFSDTGCGIAKRDQPHIFEPFYTTKGEGKGTGLGLAQVYGLVSQHGGHIDFFSEEGSGTVFTIYLPAARPLPPAQQVSDEPGMCRGNNELVLIVEDSSALLDSTVQGLRQLGYRALAAHRGIEALRLLEGQRDEIVAAICDVVLPEMSGIETIRHMRTIKPDIKVVLMSGYLPEESRNDLSSLDISEYLQKPFSLQKLAQALHTALT
jgi:two-component system cell cycle sensor histidine kinase/response regulator CckA